MHSLWHEQLYNRQMLQNSQLLSQLQATKEEFFIVNQAMTQPMSNHFESTSSLHFFQEECQQLLALTHNNQSSKNNHQVATTSSIPNLASSSASIITSNLFHSSLVSSISHLNNSIKSTWIIDSSATNHIVHSIDFLTKITKKINTKVKLPNGESVQVSHLGNVKIID